MTYKVTQSWTGGFTADVAVRNTGGTAIDGWKLGWTFQGSEKVSGAWNATTSQSGADVTATNVAHNAAIPAGGTVGFGFQGTGTPAGTPTGFELNGRECGLA